jgi:hypothetical protein
MRNVIEWLLEPAQPAIRYLTMRDVLGGTSRGDLEEARRAIVERGWVADLLSKQRPDGRWLGKEINLYRPRFVSTNWVLLALSDLGVTKDDWRIARACALWRDSYSREDGGFDTPGAEHSEHCLTGNTARALTKFGYADDSRVRSALDLLVKEQKEDGGWHCFPSSTGTIDAWEGMSAFAAYPREKWTRGMKAAVDRGCEFFLERGLCRQGRRYDPWLRLHFPYHYYYDILVGLEFMTALGRTDDRRLDVAVTLLKAKRRKDGLWNLDAVHPDLDNGGKWPRWWAKEGHDFTPFALERPGRPSKIITLRALVVMKRLASGAEQSAPTSSHRENFS